MKCRQSSRCSGPRPRSITDRCRQGPYRKKRRPGQVRRIQRINFTGGSRVGHRRQLPLTLRQSRAGARRASSAYSRRYGLIGLGTMSRLSSR